MRCFCCAGGATATYLRCLTPRRSRCARARSGSGCRACLCARSARCSAVLALVQLYCCWRIGDYADAQRCASLLSIIVFALLRSRSAAMPYSPSCSFIAAGSLATALTRRGFVLLRSAQHLCCCSSSRCSAALPYSPVCSFIAGGSLATALTRRDFALLRSAWICTTERKQAIRTQY